MTPPPGAVDKSGWLEEYLLYPGDVLDARSELIEAVQADPLDYDAIETQVQKSMHASDVESGYCSKCRHLLANWPDLGSRDWACAVGRALTTKELEAAAKAGCHFCGFILTRMKTEGLLDTFRRLEARLERLKHDGTASISIQNWGKGHCQILWVNFPGKETHHTNSPGPQCKIHSIGISPELGGFAGYRFDPITEIKTWLTECSKEHTKCCSSRDIDLPTRLISIGEDGLRLVITKDLDNAAIKYATLSYCWGKEQFYKLTPSRLRPFMEHVPADALPKTFQDAVRLAQALDIQYIWIDALCIIQEEDDNVDWLQECVRMRSVYGGSYINIAASCAKSVNEGCFLTPEGFRGGFMAKVQDPEKSRVCAFYAMDVYEESTLYTHLASRAWTLQERLLAPRTVFLGKHGVFWECRSSTKSEYLPFGFPGRLGSHLVTPEDEPFDWGDIVRLYSKTQLTHMADRLPALSGIAKQQQNVTGDQYLAGMWRGLLAGQLPWVRKSCHPRPAWRAPSWSWASGEGEARYSSNWNHPNMGRETHVEILDAWTKPVVGSDPFGPVEAGELTMACSMLLKATVSQHKGKGGNDNPQDTTSLVLETGSVPIKVSLDYLEEYSHQSVFVLPVYRGRGGMTFTTYSREQSRKGFFRRIGSYYLHDVEDDDGSDVYDFEKQTKILRPDYAELTGFMEKSGPLTAREMCLETRLNATEM
ncbi:hypothetical protein PspLS_05163, partial [Pyricularia sp. CBS 133598]